MMWETTATTHGLLRRAAQAVQEALTHAVQQAMTQGVQQAMTQGVPPAEVLSFARLDHALAWPLPPHHSPKVLCFTVLPV